MVKYSHKPQLSHFQRVKNLCWVSGPGRVLTLAFEELCDLGARHLASMSYCHLVHERRKIFNSCMKRVDGGVCLDPWVGMRCILHIFSYHYDKTPNKTTEGRFFFSGTQLRDCCLSWWLHGAWSIRQLFTFCHQGGRNKKYGQSIKSPLPTDSTTSTNNATC